MGRPPKVFDPNDRTYESIVNRPLDNDFNTFITQCDIKEINKAIQILKKKNDGRRIKILNHEIEMREPSGKVVNNCKWRRDFIKEWEQIRAAAGKR